MANKVVRTLAARSRQPVPVVEGMWRRAKRWASREGEKGNYLLVTEVVKRMLGLTQVMKVARVGQRIRWKNPISGCTLEGVVHGTLPDAVLFKVSNPQADPQLAGIIEQANGIFTVGLLEVEILD